MEFNPLEKYQGALQNDGTRFFILDTKGSSSNFGDVDFKVYAWSRKRYDLVRTGDLFLYRRPTSSSETGKFYVFGAAQIGEITALDDGNISAEIINPTVFSNLYSDELKAFKWTFKERKNTWKNFFNQYGMTRISKADLLGIIDLALII